MQSYSEAASKLHSSFRWEFMMRHTAVTAILENSLQGREEDAELL